MLENVCAHPINWEEAGHVPVVWLLLIINVMMFELDE